MSQQQAEAGRGATNPEAAPDDRYGPTHSPAQRRRRVLVAVVVAAVLGLGATIWVSAGVLSVPVRTQDAGFAIVDDGAIDVTFFVNKAPDAVARCRVHALNPSFAEVGALDVTIGASDSRSVRVTVRVATSERATTGLVQRCWIVTEP